MLYITAFHNMENHWSTKSVVECTLYKDTGWRINHFLTDVCKHMNSTRLEISHDSIYWLVLDLYFKISPYFSRERLWYASHEDVLRGKKNLEIKTAEVKLTAWVRGKNNILFAAEVMSLNK